jgi:TolB-like protein
MSLFDELKRRNVFRVAAAYVVLAWVLVQVAGELLPVFGAPDWVMRVFVLALAAGFAGVLVFSWVYELTPDGIRRESQIDRAQSVAAHTGKRLDQITIALVVVALGVFLADRFWWERESESLSGATVSNRATAASPESDSDPLSQASIAVLPFVNMSEDKANEHFGDGLAEELLNLLAKVPTLKVAARTSSFHFKGKDTTIADIAKALQVETILEGSVRRSGDTVRVVAQLIKASDGTHLWSEKYDRTLSDIFVVQDEIAGHIVKALLPKLGAAEQPVFASGAGGISPDLYERFLLARRGFYDGTLESAKQAHQEFRAIAEAAPDYAPVRAWLARTWLAVQQARGGDVPPGVARPAAQQEIDRALALDPNEAMAYLVQGQLWRQKDDQVQALAAFDHALALNPALVDAHVARQNILVEMGRAPEALKALETARAIDPLHPVVLADLAHLLNLENRRVEAFSAIERLYGVNPARGLSMEAHLYGDNDEEARAIRVLELDLREHPDDADRLEALAGRYQGLGLHDDPLVARSRYAYGSLAVLGQREAALAGMNAELAKLEDQDARAWAEFFTYYALGDYEKCTEALWARWHALPTKSIGATFGIFEGIFLAALLQRDGQVARAQELMPALAAAAAKSSPLHDASHWFLLGEVALVEGRTDDAVAAFKRLADTGDTGLWYFGRPLEPYWLFESDPRFKPIRERIVANRDAQIAELERLRKSGMSAAQARAEYVAQLRVKEKPP